MTNHVTRDQENSADWETQFKTLARREIFIAAQMTVMQSKQVLDRLGRCMQVYMNKVNQQKQNYYACISLLQYYIWGKLTYLKSYYCKSYQCVMIMLCFFSIPFFTGYICLQCLIKINQ